MENTQENNVLDMLNDVDIDNLLKDIEEIKPITKEDDTTIEESKETTEEKLDFSELANIDIDDVIDNLDDTITKTQVENIIAGDDYNTFNIDTMDNMSVEDILKMSSHKKEFDKSKIEGLTYVELIQIKDTDDIYEHLSQDQKEIVQKEKNKKFIMESFGSEIQLYMEKKGVIEILLTQDGHIWVEEFGLPERYDTGIVIPYSRSKRIIELLASFNDNVITREKPKIDGITPNGMRFSALMYDAVQHKNVFSIRKPSGVVIPLENYIDRNVMSKEQVELIVKAIQMKKNIILSGGTSSGKTTAMNSFSTVFKGSSEHVITIEDTPELMVSSNMWTQLISGAYISQNELMQQCMRLSPDRMLVGEIRTGKSAEAFLKAANSGHDGVIATTHASTAKKTLNKFEMFLDELPGRQNHWRLIEDAIDIIINVGINPITKERPMIKEIKVVKGYNKKEMEYMLEDLKSIDQLRSY